MTGETSFEFFPDGSCLICIILVVLAFENKALVFSLEYRCEELEYLSSLLGILDHFILGLSKYVYLGDKFSPFNER